MESPSKKRFGVWLIAIAWLGSCSTSPQVLATFSHPEIVRVEAPARELWELHWLPACGIAYVIQTSPTELLAVDAGFRLRITSAGVERARDVVPERLMAAEHDAHG